MTRKAYISVLLSAGFVLLAIAWSVVWYVYLDEDALWPTYLCALCYGIYLWSYFKAFRVK